MATLYALEMSGDNPTSPFSGAVADGVPGGALECTEAQFNEFKSKTANFPGSDIWRFTYIADVLTELADPRPTVTWVDTEGVGTTDPDGNVTIEVLVGDSPPKVTLRHEDPTHKPIPPDVAKIGNKLMSLPFNDGDALLEIHSDYARRDTYESADIFAMANTFTINVVSIML